MSAKPIMQTSQHLFYDFIPWSIYVPVQRSGGIHERR